jgi:hypothetical protein
MEASPSRSLQIPWTGIPGFFRPKGFLTPCFPVRKATFASQTLDVSKAATPWSLPGWVFRRLGLTSANPTSPRVGTCKRVRICRTSSSRRTTCGISIDTAYSTQCFVVACSITSIDPDSFCSSFRGHAKGAYPSNPLLRRYRPPHGLAAEVRAPRSVPGSPVQHGAVWLVALHRKRIGPGPLVQRIRE